MSSSLVEISSSSLFLCVICSSALRQALSKLLTCKYTKCVEGSNYILQLFCWLFHIQAGLLVLGQMFLKPSKAVVLIQPNRNVVKQSHGKFQDTDVISKMIDLFTHHKDNADLSCKPVLSHISLILKEKDTSRGRTHLVCKDKLSILVLRTNRETLRQLCKLKL